MNTRGMTKVAVAATRHLNKDLLFWTRPGMSDEKAIKEVITRRGYARHGFTPVAGEKWQDFGGNIGAFSVWAAAHDRSIQVEVFEPDPIMCEMITANARLNKMTKQITVVQAAVVADARRKHVTLHKNVARGNVWRNSIEREWRGQEDIKVPAVSIINVIDTDAHMKMDIEGTEMPILERLVTTPRLLPPRIVFEWSFDVDTSIERFHAVIIGLKQHYEEVTYGGFDETASHWKPEWFPPCRLVWAY